ncbi:MAG: TetR/AcrR family transcriptional regulator [Chloroflexi bacterium]|nr:TetR/AcrR family transcriptional regulator [Chloroflexota bacterium]
MRERPFNTINVTDLVEAAGVGRTTFYRNFDEIEDILRMRNDQVFEGLVAYLKAYRDQHAFGPDTNLLKPVLRFFYLNSDIIELLIMAHRIDMFQDSIKRMLIPYKPMFAEFYGVNDVYVEYVIAMRLGTVINALTHWIETGKREAPDELADKLYEINKQKESPWLHGQT